MQADAVQWGWLLCAAVLGYLVGTVSPAALIARVQGIDILRAGSGNPGATNAGRVLGRRYGYVVGLLDVLKGLLPALILGVLVDPLAGMVAGVAAVLGHCTSPWLHGHGGKGVATSFGAILGVEPLWGLIGLTAFLVAFLLTRWVALASVVAALWVVVAATVRWGYDSHLASFERLVWACVLAGIVVVRHRRNFVQRLARDATERADPRRGTFSWLVVGATLGGLIGAWLPLTPGCSSLAVCIGQPGGGCAPDPCSSWWRQVLAPVGVGVLIGLVVAGTVRAALVHRRAARA